MTIKFLALKKCLTEFYPVLAIGGEDAYLRGKALETIVSALGVVTPEFNVNTFDEQSAAEDILYACESLPFGSPKKIVVADCSSGQKILFSPKDREKIEKYCAKPNDLCCLIFILQKFSDFVLPESVVKVDCARLPKKELIEWAKARAKILGKNLAEDAAETLVEYCLGDMTRISTETEKLSGFVDDIVTEEDVEKLVGRGREYRVYELANLIAAKKSGALEMLADMLRSGEEPTSLLALLYSFYRRMYYVSVTRGLSAGETAELLGVKEFAVTKTQETMAKYNQFQLKDALGIFEDAECKIKKTWGKDENLLNMVALKLLNL